jgi:UDP-glucose 4-epimerase
MAHHLVTGGAGFIGSHLTEALLARGDRVTIVDDESTGCFGNLRSVEGNPNLTIVRGSVTDAGLVRSLVDESDQVFHLAAAVGVQLIANAPLQTIETNIYPTELIFSEVLRRQQAGANVKIFLASSSEVYGKNPKPRWTEDDDLVFGPTRRARWSYGASKAIDEFLALAYWRQYQLPVVVGRFFNVAGPRQSGAYGMVLPRFVSASLDGGPIVVHDDGQQSRCFGHVADVVASVLELMSADSANGEVFNIGSDDPISILGLAQKVVAAVDADVEIRFQSYAEAYSEDFEDIRCRVPDLTKLRHTIAHRPNFDLDGIVADVVRWHRAVNSQDAPQ